MVQQQNFPRTALSAWPTPIQHLTRLSDHLGGAQVFMKRDDLGGLAFGGNKLRKLEFLVGDALAKGAGTIVTAGALQSNHARLTAAVSARLGLGCHLVLKDEVADRSAAYHRTANRFLDELLGATVEIVKRDESLPDAVAARVAALTEADRDPYLIPIGGSNATGCLGYVACAEEIAAQQVQIDGPPSHIFVVSGSGGTHAGLVVGSAHAGLQAKIVGVTISRAAADQEPIVANLVNETAALLGLPAGATNGALHFEDGFYLPGYGQPNAATLEAISLCARLEGILLDPVYTGKAMAALIAGIRSGAFANDDRLLFVHTGGAPALFAYEDAFEPARRRE